MSRTFDSMAGAELYIARADMPVTITARGYAIPAIALVVPDKVVRAETHAEALAELRHLLRENNGAYRKVTVRRAVP